MVDSPYLDKGAPDDGPVKDEDCAGDQPAKSEQRPDNIVLPNRHFRMGRFAGYGYIRFFLLIQYFLEEIRRHGRKQNGDRHNGPPAQIVHPGNLQISFHREGGIIARDHHRIAEILDGLDEYEQQRAENSGNGQGQRYRCKYFQAGSAQIQCSILHRRIDGLQNAL